MAVKVNGYQVNSQVRDKEVRVISANGEQLGIMSAKEAQVLANSEGLDLVKISPNAKPPVCKIVNYGKFKYEMERREKEAKKNQKVTVVKEIQLSPNIDKNDFQTKLGHAKKFLSKGNKVKISLRFRGREMSHMEQTRRVLDEFVESLYEVATADKPANVEGRSLTVMLSPKR